MNLFTSFVVTIAIFALTASGHYQHGHGHGHDHAVAVHYTTVTEHKTDAHDHGGKDQGHATVHTWGHDGGDADHHHGDHSAGHDHAHDHHAYPKYEFNYGVKDPKTGDIKSHKEARDGSSVKGSYTVKEADGTTRHVEYSADKHNGFKAIVHTLGHAHHAAHNEGHGHGVESYDHGHDKATSYVIVKKQEEEKKH